MSMSQVFALLFVVGFMAAQVAPQALPKPEEVVELRAVPAELMLPTDGIATLKLVAEIRPGFHINSNKPLQEYLVPTQIILPEAGGFELLEVKYPQPQLKRFPFAPDEDVAVFAGTLEVSLQLRASAVRDDRHRLKVALRYQACNDRICLRPAQRTVEISVNVIRGSKKPG